VAREVSGFELAEDGGRWKEVAGCTHVLTILFVTTPELEVSVTFPSMIGKIEIGYLGKQGTGIGGKRMEC
jgi:hypothetical protein